MPYPGLVASGDIISAAHINAIRNSLVDATTNVVATSVTSPQISATSVLNIKSPDDGTSYRNQFFFLSPTGILQHSIYQDAALGNQLTMIPGQGGGANTTFRVRGNQVVDGSLIAANIEITSAIGIALRGSVNRYITCESPHLAFYKKRGSFPYYWRVSNSGNLAGDYTDAMTLNDSGALALYGDGSDDNSGSLNFVSPGAYYRQTRVSSNGYMQFYGAQAGFSGFLFSNANPAGVIKQPLVIHNDECIYMGGAWNAGHLVLGSHHIWVDGSSRLRIKAGAPTADTDGTVVGAQS